MAERLSDPDTRSTPDEGWRLGIMNPGLGRIKFKVTLNWIPVLINGPYKLEAEEEWGLSLEDKGSVRWSDTTTGDISKYKSQLHSTVFKSPISGMLGCWHVRQFNHPQKAYAPVTNKNTRSRSQIRPDCWTRAISEHETDSHLSSVHNLLFCFASNLIKQLWHTWIKHDTKPLLQVYFPAFPLLNKALKKVKTSWILWTVPENDETCLVAVNWFNLRAADLKVLEGILHIIKISSSYNLTYVLVVVRWLPEKIIYYQNLV